MGVITRGIANNILSGGTIDATDGLSGTVSASNITDSSISSVTAFPAAAGDFIQSTASDPSPATIGDVWYNNATYAFKVATVSTVGTFASGGSLPVALYGTMAAGTQTAAVNSGGYIGSGPTPAGKRATTNEYDGTSWTSSSDMNTARFNGNGTGIQTAALFFGGSDGVVNGLSESESYDGTSFSTTPSLATARGSGASGGTQSSAVLGGGGTNASPTKTAVTEEFTGAFLSTKKVTLT